MLENGANNQKAAFKALIPNIFLGYLH